MLVLVVLSGAPGSRSGRSAARPGFVPDRFKLRND